jgi:hypothetical protein
MGVFQGCTPGFWKNHPEDWVGFSPTDSFNDTFGRIVFTPDITLDEALDLMGGGIEALARHAVAALLNAADPMVNYPLTVAQVISEFQTAFDAGGAAIEEQKDRFDAFNNLGCPL